MDKSSYFQLLNPLMLLIFAGGFAAIYVNDRRLASARWMAFAYVVGAFGFVMDFAVRDAAGPHLGAYVSNIPFMAALLLIAGAFYRRYDRPFPWIVASAIFIGTIGLMTLVIAHDPFSYQRALVMNFGSGLAYALSIPAVWSKRQGRIERVLLAILALSVLQSFVRPVAVVAIGPEGGALAYSDSTYALTLHLVSAVCAISLAVTLFFALGMDLVVNLHRRAEEDQLTGILNRRGFERRIAETFSYLDRSPLPFSIVACDIDHFKQVNDIWGHGAGDAVIAAFARSLVCPSRASDFAARLGGEEFVIALWNTDGNGARLYAEGRRALFSTTAVEALPSGEFRTASFGVAEREPGETLERLMARADAALYDAKRTGRNRVVLAPRGADLALAA